MITKENWREFLIRNERGDALKRHSQQNVLLMMRFDADRFGEFWREGEMIKVKGGHWNQRGECRNLTEGDIIAIMGHLEYSGIKAGRTTVKRAIDFIIDQVGEGE